MKNEFLNVKLTDGVITHGFELIIVGEYNETISEACEFIAENLNVSYIYDDKTNELVLLTSQGEISNEMDSFLADEVLEGNIIFNGKHKTSNFEDGIEKEDESGR